MDFERKKRYSL